MSKLRRRDLEWGCCVKIDKYRRLTLPTHVLEFIGISKGHNEPLDIAIKFGSICLRKFNAERLSTIPFTGLVRNMDDKNRIYIPKQYCDILHIEPEKTEFIFLGYGSGYHDPRQHVILVPLGYGGTHL